MCVVVIVLFDLLCLKVFGKFDIFGVNFVCDWILLVLIWVIGDFIGFIWICFIGFLSLFMGFVDFVMFVIIIFICVWMVDFIWGVGVVVVLVIVIFFFNVIFCDE